MGRATGTGTLILVALVACGGGDDDGLEVGELSCPEDVHARFQVYVLDDIPGVFGEYDDRPGIGLGLDTEDGCRTYIVPEQDDGNDGGDGDGPPQAMDIGVVRLTGIEPELALMPADDNTYRSSFAEYVPGAEVGVTGGGEGTGAEPFDIRVVAVPALTVASTTYIAAGGEDLTLTWDPADSPAGTRVGLYAELGGFDSDVLECWWDDDGQGTIPAADLAILPGGDSFDIALLTRIDYAAVETERGCAALQTWSRLDLDISR